MTATTHHRNAFGQLEAPVTVFLMLLYLGLAAFVMLEWGGFATAFARAVEDTGNAPAASLPAAELE